MKIKTGFLAVTALCFGLVMTSGFAGGTVTIGSTKPFGIKLSTQSDPVVLACTHGVRVSATKYRSGFVPFPAGETKLLCNLHVFKGGQHILVTDYSFRIQHKGYKGAEYNKVKVHNAGLPQYDNSESRHILTDVRWGDGVWVHFMNYDVKGPVKTLFKK